MSGYVRGVDRGKLTVDSIMAVIRSGAKKHCPYCLGILERRPASGTSITFLDGPDVGYSAVVDSYNDPDYFLVRMDYERRQGVLRMVAFDHDLYVDSALLTAPSWMPRLSIEDNAALHFAALNFLGGQNLDISGHIITNAITSLIHCCWWRRFPLDGKDVWPMVHAHGAKREIKEDFLRLFDFGKALLIDTNRRKPNRRRLMSSMSKGRYQTSAQAALRLSHFGHE